MRPSEPRDLAILFAALGALAVAPLAVGATGLQDENLLTGFPAGFIVGSAGSQGPMNMIEYVPKGETVQNWTSMVTVQIFHNLRTADPDTFIAGIGKRWAGACKDATVTRVTGGRENGFPFALWLMACPLNPSTRKPETTYFKVIGGDDALYGVQYAYRRPLDAVPIAPTMRYLHQVSVCDTRRADRPCPTGLMNARPLPSRVR